MQCIRQIAEIDSTEWNALAGTDYPFLRHEFLSALETSGAVSPQTGWQAQHLLVMDNQALIAVMPLYLKFHSWGEYVFDQAWAQAYQSHGLAYYPKYLTSIPFTPCVGPRLIIKADQPFEPIVGILLKFIQSQADLQGVSSWHCLFAEPGLIKSLAAEKLIIRETVQFQWFNRGYSSLDDFLATLTASKRKMIKRERRKVREQGIYLQRLLGKQIQTTDWQLFYRFYALTYLKRQSQPYLNLAFFLTLASTMPEQLQLILAIKDSQPVAAALFFEGTDSLFGRYWGCDDEYDALHFEACYYQGIDYCIAQGLKRFDSGAQGEHKIARGFEPISTHSAHWIKAPEFALAIHDFVRRETNHINQYRLAAAAYLPFREAKF